MNKELNNYFIPDLTKIIISYTINNCLLCNIQTTNFTVCDKCTFLIWHFNMYKESWYNIYNNSYRFTKNKVLLKRCKRDYLLQNEKYYYYYKKNFFNWKYETHKYLMGDWTIEKNFELPNRSLKKIYYSVIL